MQHTLVAVFDNRSDAQNAMDELLASGFTRSDVSVSSADPTGQTSSLSTSSGATGLNTDTEDQGIGASIKHFFSGIFGTDNSEHAQRYSDVVSRGHHVLTLTTQSEPEVERAADVIERFGPVDIDERHDLSGSAASLDPGMLAAGASAGSGLSSSSSSMQSQSMGSGSMGSGSMGSGSLGSGSMQGGELGGGIGQDRNAFATQNINDPVPMGQTFQEPMGGSMQIGDSLGQGDSMLQGSSSLQGSADDSLGGTIQTGSLQGGSSSGSQQREVQRGGVRVFSREAGNLSGAQDDDSYYRTHWSSNLASSGGAYDDYQPAYRYGSEARSKYQGRNWDDVESDLRSDWDARNTGGGASTWDKMKAAVRGGWDRMTS